MQKIKKQLNLLGLKRLTIFILVIAVLMASKPLTAHAAILVNDFSTLKSTIEGATSDVEIELTNVEYIFTSAIQNPNNIRVTIHGKCLSKFVMDPSVPSDTRFIHLVSGFLDMDTVIVQGTSGKNGGIFARSMDLDNCIFLNNHSTSGGGAVDYYNPFDSSPIDLKIERSYFKGNTSPYDGGAIRFELNYSPTTSSGSNSSIYISDCHFEENIRTVGGGIQYGGAVSIKTTKTVTIQKSFFKDNKALSSGNGSYGGALHLLAVEFPTVSECVFIDNEATTGGGALSIFDCANRNSGFNSYTTIQNCTFVGNQSAYGGGLYINNQGGQLLHVQNSTFAENQASVAGGAVYYQYGPFTNSYFNSTTFINNDLAGNSGNAGMINISNVALLGTPAIILTPWSNNGNFSIAGTNELDSYSPSTLYRNTGAKIVSTGSLYENGSVQDTLRFGTISRGLSQNGYSRKSAPDIGSYELVSDSLANYTVKYYQLGTSTSIAPDKNSISIVGNKIWAFDEVIPVSGYHYRVANTLVTTLTPGTNVVELYYCPDTIISPTPTPTVAPTITPNNTQAPANTSTPAPTLPIPTESNILHTFDPNNPNNGGTISLVQLNPIYTSTLVEVVDEIITEGSPEVPVTGSTNYIIILVLFVIACSAGIATYRKRKQSSPDKTQQNKSLH